MSEKEMGQLLYESRPRNKPLGLLSGTAKARYAQRESAVRADERRKVIEECAGVAEGEAYGFPTADLTEHGQGYERACKEIAAAIRALKGADE